jgi:twitching motility protein PilJ
MALNVKLPKLFGKGPRPAATSRLDMPTTQVRAAASPQGYDPLASVSVMEQLRTASAEVRMPRKLPLIGRLPVMKQFQVVGVLLLTFLVFAAFMVFMDARTASQAAASIATGTEMQMLSQRLARAMTLAAQGQAAAFPAVRESSERFKADVVALQDGGTVRGVSLDVAHDETEVALLQRIRARFEIIEAGAARVLESERSLVLLGKAVETLVAGNVALLDLAPRAAQQVSQGSAGTREAEQAAQLGVLAQRMARSAGVLAPTAAVDPDAAAQLGKDAAGFRDILAGLLKGSDALRLAPVRGDEARATLAELQKQFGAYEAAVATVLQNAGKLTAARQAAAGIGTETEVLFADAMQLTGLYEGAGRSRAMLWAAIVFAVAALAMLMLMGKVFLDDARVRAWQSEQENKRNQEAILRLLNEMGNLADGDLTVQASVTEDVTGAIADSINFTIEELRTLVKGINSATDQVTKATLDAQAISNRLYEASQRQNREIRQSTESVLQMTQSINDVSQSAEQSARVAQQSLAAADQGAQSVQNQIAGMNEIRTQIQDTSKRIKRLGDSSLEIGEIVELISDITEQTNVLALNAAIQAASAGEAGRGFTVVAEEVQRLAERSAEATKQIDAIVKTIQADTQDAVAAMEKSTHGVVEGTKLSDAAGSALEEIRRVSRELAELIGRISTQTHRQSTSVSEVTRGMQGILRITEETTEGTKESNVSIGQLTRLAADLRSSVAGFTL